MTKLEFDLILKELKIDDLVSDDYGVDLYKYNDLYLYFDGECNAIISNMPDIGTLKIESIKDFIDILSKDSNKTLKNVTNNMLSYVNSIEKKEDKDESINIRDVLDRFDRAANPFKFNKIDVTNSMLDRLNIDCDDKKGSISTIVYDDNVLLKYTSYPGNSFLYQIDYYDGDSIYSLEHYLYEGKEKFYIGKKGPERHLREITYNLSDKVMADSKYNRKPSKIPPIIQLDYELMEKRIDAAITKSNELITGFQKEKDKNKVIL